MKEKFSKPKGFGEILDHTFRLAKNRFSDFFMVLLILMGPIYLLQALIQLTMGTNFLREVGSGDNWFDQVLTSFDQGSSPESIGADPGSTLGLILTGLATIILLPVAQVAILYIVNHIRKNEEYTVGAVIKQAFSRFWPIFGSSLLMALITIGMFVGPLIIVFMVGFAGSFVNPIIGILFGILLFLGLALVVALLLIRWSFYLGVVAFGKEAPGLSKSWKLTRHRTWILFGIYIIFTLIVGAISTAVEVPVMLLLGNSVLYTIIINVVSLFTTMIISVGYAVVYFDLKIRVDADDLKELIEDYNGPR
ncbi:hypothetical protein GH741_10930 [Aquibacillus halophilus]|uniref:Glycerophosphoryl diester phosphodiesterase membrane domain-containing protein n=1 Tax=Aquibacillus halophilus TaxID=930132 RepID=A0A6A8DCC6_9BACI|nr:hypothetical protein [Aquibacillus halophilus]MRH43194.1 hypothetical protein [Aquibacillus halophilus]